MGSSTTEGDRRSLPMGGDCQNRRRRREPMGPLPPWFVLGLIGHIERAAVSDESDGLSHRHINSHAQLGRAYRYRGSTSPATDSGRSAVPADPPVGRPDIVQSQRREACLGDGEFNPDDRVAGGGSALARNVAAEGTDRAASFVEGWPRWCRCRYLPAVGGSGKHHPHAVCRLAERDSEHAKATL